MKRSIESPWPIEVLTGIGFHPRDAARLRPLLPPVDVDLLQLVHLQHIGRHNGEDSPRHHASEHPAALVVWAVHNVTIKQAERLTRGGRGLVDVLVILDAVHKHVHHRLSIEGIDLAMEWVTNRHVPRDRLARYIALGIPPARAAALEADTSARPSEAALDVLAALRPKPGDKPV